MNRTRITLALTATLLTTSGVGYALTRDIPYTLTTTQPHTPRVVSSQPVAELDTYPADSPAPVCHEEDPCWDCAEMGNKLCGPLPMSHRDVPARRPTQIVMLPDGNWTAIAQGPAVAPQETPAPVVNPETPAAAAVVAPSTTEPAATPVVWVWRTPTRENGWTQSGEGATGCWTAYDLRRKPMREHAPELNAFNWEVMRRNGAEPLACSHPDVIDTFDPTVALEEPAE